MFKNNLKTKNSVANETTFAFRTDNKNDLNKVQLKHQFNDTDPISFVIKKNLQEFKNHFSQNHLANTDKNFRELESKLDNLSKKKQYKNPYKLDKPDNQINKNM